MIVIGDDRYRVGVEFRIRYYLLISSVLPNLLDQLAQIQASSLGVYSDIA